MMRNDGALRDRMSMVRRIGVMGIVGVCACIVIIQKLFLWKYAIHHPEVLSHGIVAKDILDGLKASLHEYRFVAYHGGGVFYGILVAPFFAWWGDTFAVLYGVYLMVNGVIVCSVYWFAHRYFNHRVALVAMFFYCTLPPHIVWESIASIGIHTEASFFLMMTCVFWLELIKLLYKSERDPHRISRFIHTVVCVGAGVIVGISMYGTLYVSVAVGYCVLMWVIVDPLLWRKRWVYCCGLGVIIGLMPYIGEYLKTHSFMHLEVHSAQQEQLLWSCLWQKSWSDIGELVKRMNIVFSTVFQIKYEHSASGIYIPHYLYWYMMCTLIAMSVVGVFHSWYQVRKRTDRESRPMWICTYEGRVVFVIGFLLLWGVLYVLHPMKWPFTAYLIPIYPFVGIGMGCGMNYLWEMKWRTLRFRSLAIVLTAILCGGGVFFYRASESNYNWDLYELPQYKGYSFELAFGTHANRARMDFMRNDLNLLVGMHYERAYDEWQKHRALLSFAHEDIGYLREDRSRIEHMEALYRSQSVFVLGLSRAGKYSVHDLRSLYEELERSFPKEYRHFYYEGVAFAFCNRRGAEVFPLFHDGSIEVMIPKNFQHYFYMEYGRRLAEYSRVGDEVKRQWIAAVPEEFSLYAWMGFLSGYEKKSADNVMKEVAIELTAAQGHRRYNEYVYAMRAYEVRRGMYGTGRKDGISAEDGEGRYRNWGWGCLRMMNGVAIQQEKNTPGGYFINRRIDALRTVIIEEMAAIETGDAVRDRCRGYGMGFSLCTFGQLSLYDAARVKKTISIEYQTWFFEGYGMGIALRYGWDDKYIEHILRTYGDAENMVALRRGVSLWREVQQQKEAI